jgi:hypothetical protein
VARPAPCPIHSAAIGQLGQQPDPYRVIDRHPEAGPLSTASRKPSPALWPASSAAIPGPAAHGATQDMADCVNEAFVWTCWA